MTYPATNTFTTYALSEDEVRQGQSLNSLNVAVFQNQRAQIAEEKLALVFTPNDVLSYTQQEAYLKGQLDILSYIITTSEEQIQQHHITDKE